MLVCQATQNKYPEEDTLIHMPPRLALQSQKGSTVLLFFVAGVGGAHQVEALDEVIVAIGPRFDQLLWQLLEGGVVDLTQALPPPPNGRVHPAPHGISVVPGR